MFYRWLIGSGVWQDLDVDVNNNKLQIIEKSCKHWVLSGKQEVMELLNGKSNVKLARSWHIRVVVIELRD